MVVMTVPISEPRATASNRSPARSGGAREQIMATARRLFYTRGINATGIDLVIAEAGVAKGSMYHHFANKQALVVAYLQQEEATWKVASDTRDDPRASTTERLRSFFDGISVDVLAGTFHGCPFMNAAIERPDEPGVGQVIAHYREALASHIAHLLGEGGSSTVVDKVMVLYAVRRGENLRQDDTESCAGRTGRRHGLRSCSRA